jgi:hypothetical protein
MAKDRHLEVSAKLIEMGRALMKEGKDDRDFVLAQTGSSMIAVGGLLLDEQALLLFGQVCGLFASKMILDNMEKNKHDYMMYLKDKSEKETYEDFIRRINKMREDNGHEPLGEA